MNPSRLCPRLANLTSINPRELGYILKDGSIQFADQRTAIQYAKNKIVAALNTPAPFERAAAIKGGRVAVVDGEVHTVSLKGLPKFNEADIVMHGHSSTKSGITAPFSKGDIKSFLHLKFTNNIKKSILYNRDGEECVMSAISNSHSLFDKLPEKFKNFVYSCNPKFKKKFADVDCVVKTHEDNVTGRFSDIADRCSKQEAERINELMRKTNRTPQEEELLNSLISHKSRALAEHDAIKELADRLDFRYRTNFSTLVD